MNRQSRLKYLSVLCFLAMLAGLWLAARDGDVLSIVVLAAIAVLLLFGLGATIAVLIMYVMSRINRSTTESISNMADAQRSMATAMAAQGRTFAQLPGSGAMPMPAGYQAGNYTLPPMTSFKSIEGEVDENI